jgi:hypothetical protein
MRSELYDLNVVAAGTGAGTPFPCRHHIDKFVQASSIAGGATLKIEGTIDGANWVQSGADIVANGVYEVPEHFDQIRVNRSVRGTDNPAVKLAGRQAKAD